MIRILSVSSSRADVGILLPVWRALAQSKQCELHVFVTGMHLAEKAPPLPEPPPGIAVHRGGADLGGADPETAAIAMSEIERAAAKVYRAATPDLIVLMGDRLDMLPAATASLPFNIPLAHLHGGEVTDGAIDDRIRNAISKLAHVHFVASEGARKRLIAMGESPERIHVTGGPGLDTMLMAPVMSRRSFLDSIGFSDQADDVFLRLVTVHPETNSAEFDGPLNAILAALAKRPGPTLFTAPNNDPSGNSLMAAIQQFVVGHAWAKLIDTLGPERYPNALRHVDVMVGNSSSGIIEAGMFGMPVIDVGMRQSGRERASNVQSVPADANAIFAAFEQLEAKRPRFPNHSPYGDGRSAPRIAQALLALPPRDRLLAKGNSS